MSRIAPDLQSFFTSYLIGQKDASPHTITSYRDTWKLLLTYIQEQAGIPPTAVDFTDLSSKTIAAFLQHLEQDRGNSPTTRNARLAGIHAFFRYSAYLHPEHADLIAHVLAIAPKNTSTPDINYLNKTELKALLAAPNTTTWSGRRDQLIMLTLVTTGLRVSELAALRWADIQLQAPTYLNCHGKGRKDRSTPLTPKALTMMRSWHRETHPPDPSQAVFTAQGTQHPMSTDAITQRLAVHSRTAARTCPSIGNKTVTPHVLRHTTAMRMLAAGVDIATISLWLGHESIESTRVYLHADMTLIQRALDHTAPPQTTPGRYKPDDQLLAFLRNL